MSVFAGSVLSLSIRGASHSRAMKFSLSGLPAGMRIDESALRAFMERRAPGRDRLSTARRETDEVRFVSGVENGTVVSSSVSGEIANRDMRPLDYVAERTIPRPGHADFGQWVQYGAIPTGGGQNSGRLTAPLCAAGVLCLQFLAGRGVTVSARADSIGGRRSGFKKTILAARKDGDSVGGTILCEIRGLPPGLGGALFEGLESAISSAVFAIPGVKGVEFGNGFTAAALRGSENDDPFAPGPDGTVETRGNRHGGILGGRTTGMPVIFRVAMKPTPTVFKPLRSVDLATMRPATCAMKGRHDPCIALRAVPAIEAAAALAVADAVLRDEASHPRICMVSSAATVDECFSQYAAQRHFSDMLEVRADLLRKGERAKVLRLAERVPVPAILTFRRKCDGGAFEGSDAEREDFFRRVLTRQARGGGRGFAYVDFEEGFGGAALAALARRAGAKIVRSLHSFAGPVPRLEARLKSLAADGDVAKVAFMPRTMDDVSRLFRAAPALRRAAGGKPYVAIAMGAKGFATRALAARTGSAWTYASAGGLGGIGHVTPHELVKTYRFRSATPSAALFGVTGWPLKATRSPEINNAAFAAEDVDAVMVPFPAETAAEAVRFMKSAGLKGMAVTIPHKRSIMPLLDRIDAAAKRTGAVNTVVEEDGRLAGYNTDVAGISEALAAFAGDLRGVRVAVLGDGGAAQAVKTALKAAGAKYETFHRATPPRGFALIVNATPVDPIPDYVFDGSEKVYDLVYVPETTPLMARAAAAGCRTENGFSMLLAQAREQRRIWL